MHEQSEWRLHEIKKVGCMVKLMQNNRKLQARHGKQLFKQM